MHFAGASSPLPVGKQGTANWARHANSCTRVLASLVILFAAPTSRAVEFSFVGPNSATVEVGEQFTIHAIMRNNQLIEISSLGASVHGYEGVAVFESGEAVSSYLNEVCLPGSGCFGGLENFAGGSLVESAIGDNGPRVQIALSSSAVPNSNDGAVDFGLDGQVGTSMFRLTFTAVGQGDFLIGTAYEGDGIIRPDGIAVRGQGALFTVEQPPEPVVEQIEFTGDTYVSGAIGGVQHTVGDPITVTIEVTDGLTFLDGEIDTGPDSGDLVSYSIQIGSTTYVADPGSFADGLTLISSVAQTNWLSNPSTIRFAGTDFCRFCNPRLGDLGAALDGESIGEFLTRTGGQLVNRLPLILDPGVATFNGGQPVTESFSTANGNLITIRLVPEPSALAQVVSGVIALVGLSLWRRDVRGPERRRES